MKKKLLLSSIILASAGLTSLPAQAIDLKVEDTNLGKLNGKFKAMHILDAKSNGYDPSEGTSYSFMLKYLSPNFNGFSVGISPWMNGDLLNETDMTVRPAFIPGTGFTGTNDRIARGMFISTDPSKSRDDWGDTKIVLGEAYVNYKGEKFSVKAGNQMLKTPLNKTIVSHVPDFYQGVTGSTTALENFKIGGGWIHKYALGSRSLAHFGLVGEGTNSAGGAGTAARNPGHLQGTFRGIDDVVGGAADEDSDGIGMLSLEYTGMKALKAGIWYQHVNEFVNNIYAQVDYTFPVGAYKLKLSGQILDQSDTGDALTAAILPANQTDTDIDYTLFGVKATLIGKGWSVYAAGNTSSGDTAMFNAWSGNPAFANSIFSYNTYREDVDAWKIGFKYKIMKGLTFVASYADYGQSDTSPVAGVGGGRAIPNMGPCIAAGPCQASNDATEADFVLIYKPQQVKGLSMRLVHMNRESEYNDSHSQELKQAHTRAIMQYKF